LPLLPYACAWFAAADYRWQARPVGCAG